MNRSATLMLPFLLFADFVLASASSRPQVVHGSATFNQNGANWQIETQTNKTIVNWNSFGVPEGSTTQFNQPKPSAAVLNRVTGPLNSEIHGSLLSNGKVYLINPNGIVVGQQGVVNTRGFVASTLNVKDKQFLRGGAMHFAGDGEGTLVNLGRITASGEDVVLIGPRIENHGEIKAEQGKAILAAGRQIALSEDHRVFFLPKQEHMDGTGVLNTGVIQAVRAELHACGSLYAMAINNEGSVNATSVVQEGGRVLLRAEGGTIRNAGTLSAKTVTTAGKTRGGEIKVLGRTVILEGAAALDASGDLGGGVIQVGGGYQGQGSSPNAEQVWVGDHVTLKANALEVGNGGTIVLWSDGANRFYGKAEAKGGPAGGDGGLIEVSGKAFLQYQGHADLTAPGGAMGTLLLDPLSGSIMDGSADGAADGNNTFVGHPSGSVGQILGPDNGPTRIYESELEAMLATANVVIQMTGDLTLENLADNLLSLNLSTGSLSLIADADGDGVGAFTFADPQDVIRTEGGSVNISAATIPQLGGIDTRGSASTAPEGAIMVTSTRPGATIGLGNTLASRGQVALHSAGGVAQATGANLIANTLQLSGAGVFALNTSVDHLNTNGQLAGALILANNKALTLSGTGIDVNGAVSLTTAAGGIFILRDLTAGGQVTLNAADGSISSRTVSGTALLLLGAGRFNLTTSVDTLATGDLGGGSLNIFNNKALTVGSLDGHNGVTAAGGIGLTSTSGSGIVLDQALNAGAGAIDLRWNGALRQNAGGVFTAGALNLQGNVSGTLSLDLNGVDRINTMGSGLQGTGTVQLSSSSGLTTNTLNANENTLVVTSAGWSAGSVTADALLLKGVGAFSLNASTQVFAADVDGTLALSNLGALTVQAVSGTSGIKTNNQNLALISGEALRINAAIDAGSGTVSLNVAAHGVTQGTGGSIATAGLKLNGSGSFILENAGNRAPVLAANVSGGDVVVRTEGNLTVGSVGNLTGITASNAAVVSLSAPNGYLELLATIFANGNGSGAWTATGDVRSAGSLSDFVLPGAGTVSLAGKDVGPVLPPTIANPPITVAPTPDLGAPDTGDGDGGGDGEGSDDTGDVPSGGDGGNTGGPGQLVNLDTGSLGIGSEWELKLPKELVKVKLTLDKIFKRGFHDPILPVTIDEIGHAREALLRASEAVAAVSPIYHDLEPEDPLKRELGEMMRELKIGRMEVRAAIQLLEHFLDLLYIKEQRDRMNQDLFMGAFEGLREANERLMLGTPVLNAGAQIVRAADGVASGKALIAKLKSTTAEARAAALRDVLLARKRLDRSYQDVLLFDWEK